MTIDHYIFFSQGTDISQENERDALKNNGAGSLAVILAKGEV